MSAAIIITRFYEDFNLSIKSDTGGTDGAVAAECAAGREIRLQLFDFSFGETGHRTDFGNRIVVRSHELRRFKRFLI